ncbi:phosphoribosylanthranilate isomerase [Fulvivirga sp. 29W222]|uniref:phosphoribosylanthranilate isomerase n=1 Tax=Fulvivirga marina TaxID=2494733 RepID=A0A937KB44_9BACT|nr:phosphoribosylanthranilate isomerase [Fulvivirga marina]MBL6445577.1 phosphoribosylanthranilate isomerase [Fulvivirga marina]
MALKTFVKVSTVNNLSDARYCAGMEVNLIGFNLEKDNSNYISPENYNELTEWLSGVQYVGEFEGYSSSEVIETIENYNIDYIQVVDVTQLEALKTLDIPLILKTDLNTLGQLPTDLAVEYLLVTSGENEISQEELKKISDAAAHYKLLLGSGVTDQNAESIVQQTNAYGIALQGGDELRPGYKDYDELADILEALEDEDY